MDHKRRNRSGGFLSRANIALAGFLVIAAFFLLTEHRAHLFGLLPWLLILLCPLMHLFMHGGHNHGENAGRPPSDRASDHRH
jgi:hypothetical protein